MARRARREEETSLVQAVDDEQRGPPGHSGSALRVVGDGGPSAASRLLDRGCTLVSSSFLASGPPAPTTRPCDVLRQSLGCRAWSASAASTARSGASRCCSCS